MKVPISIVSNIFNPTGPAAPGGLEIFNYYLSRELEKRGEDVKLFASGDSQKLRCLVPLVDKSLQFSKSKEFLFDPWNYRKITFEEFAIFAKFIEDKSNHNRVLHFNMDNFLPVYLAAKKGLPMLNTIHLLTKSLGYRILGDLLTEEEMRSVHFIGVSKRQVKDFPYNYRVIHHGVDLRDFHYSDNFSNNFIWIGRFVEAKGCSDAIAAAKKAGEKLEIGGEAKIKNEVEYFESSIKPELNRKIKLKGFVKQNTRSDFYQAKALIFSSKKDEAFGLTIIEAMACGTPVIAYARGAASEVIKEGKTGFIIQPDDVNGLVSAMKKINQLPAKEYLAMRKRCRENIEKNFSLKIMADRYLEVYNEIYQDFLSKKSK